LRAQGARGEGLGKIRAVAGEERFRGRKEPGEGIRD